MVKFYCDICGFEIAPNKLLRYQVPALDSGKRGMAEHDWHLCPVCADAYQDTFRKFVMKRREEVGK